VGNYLNPAKAGARHGAAGREPDPPKAGFFDHVSDEMDRALGTTPTTLEKIKAEADSYHQAYQSAALNRIANEK
jgi:hypothetical protein